MHGLTISESLFPSSVSPEFVVNCFLTCSVAADIQTMLEETQLKFEEERYSVFHFHTIFFRLIYWEDLKPIITYKELNKNIHLQWEHTNLCSICACRQNFLKVLSNTSKEVFITTRIPGFCFVLKWHKSCTSAVWEFTERRVQQVSGNIWYVL